MKVYRQIMIWFSLVLISFFSFGQNAIKADSSKVKKWFPQFDFDASSFQKPSLEFAPFARWWWQVMM
jgi:hypothetical protein